MIHVRNFKEAYLHTVTLQLLTLQLLNAVTVSVYVVHFYLYVVRISFDKVHALNDRVFSLYAFSFICGCHFMIYCAKQLYLVE